jgi:branched-chain amino acid transport system permease protein
MAELILQQTVNGLMMGSIYVLMALGMVLIYGVMHVLNFAHGVLFTLAGYVCHSVYFHLLGNYPAALLVAILTLVVVGAALERFVFRPLRGNLRNQVMASLGLILVIQNLIMIVWSPLGLEFKLATSTTLVPLGSISFSLQQFIIIGVSAAVIAALYLFLTGTRLGTALRATSQNPEAATVVGIDSRRMHSLAFAIGCALAAIGGALLGPVFLLFPQMGDMPLMKALAAIILGGMGNVWGAAIGGMLIGVVESLSTLVISSDWRDAITYLCIVVVILWKPDGIFGFRVRGET